MRSAGNFEKILFLSSQFLLNRTEDFSISQSYHEESLWQEKASMFIRMLNSDEYVSIIVSRSTDRV